MAHVLNGAEAEFDRGCDIGHDLFYFSLAGLLMMMSSVGRRNQRPTCCIQWLDTAPCTLLIHTGNESKTFN